MGDYNIKMEYFTKNEKMRLSVIIPVYNEEKTIGDILKRVEDVKLKDMEKEIIIVDDFSQDNTRKILKKLEKSGKYKILYHEKNRGKGAALRTGFRNMTGDIAIVQDADLEYNPEEYPALLRHVVSGRAKVVYGSRFINMKFRLFGKGRTILLSHFFGNKFLSLATTILFGKKITDMETCYKVFPRDLIKSLKLRSNKFDIEPEITAKILKRGHKILEVPINFNPRTFEAGKKINWKDGLVAFYILLKYRFSD